MNWFESEERKKINEIIAGVKVLSIFFGAIAVFSHVNIDKIDWLNLKYTLLFCTLPATAICQIWMLSIRNKNLTISHNILDIMDNITFVTLYTIIMIITGGFQSSYKALFLLCILTDTIQAGMKRGLAISVVVSCIIAAIDLLSFPLNGVNPYFQSDLVLIGIFFLTTYLLGYYIQTLSESEKRYRNLIELLPEGISVHVKGSDIVYTNGAVVDLLGVREREEIIQKLEEIGICEDGAQDLMKTMDSVEETRKNRSTAEGVLQQEDGSEINVEITPIPFLYKGKHAVLHVIQDITERKKIEELQFYDKLRTDFFANISHELRTPLNVILGTLQLLNLYLRDSVIRDSSGKILRYVNIMKQNCNRLLRLVNNLIDITRIDAGFFEIHRQNWNIVALIEDIVMSVEEYCKNNGILLQFDTEMNEKLMACDADKMERVLLNLLSNAVKFTNPGGDIRVSLYEDGDMIAISVKDTGIGIPLEKQKDIFERFRQVDRSLTRTSEGSGIGLSLIKSIVEMHGGTISLISEYGKGSEFIIKLPVVLLDQEDDPSLAMRFDAGKNNVERINIELSDIYTNH